MNRNRNKTNLVPHFQGGEIEMADKPISVRLDAETDRIVRAMPDRTAWLREAIAEKLEREGWQPDEPPSAS